MPVTMPIRAHMNCTQAISGQVMSAVHNSEVPNCAPTIEYVAMPEGSSSAAPAVTPGPRAEKNRRMRPSFLGGFSFTSFGFKQA